VTIQTQDHTNVEAESFKPFVCVTKPAGAQPSPALHLLPGDRYPPFQPCGHPGACGRTAAFFGDADEDETFGGAHGRGVVEDFLHKFICHLAPAGKTHRLDRR
jgi:hypothetical protein